MLLTRLVRPQLSASVCLRACAQHTSQQRAYVTASTAAAAQKKQKAAKAATLPVKSQMPTKVPHVALQEKLSVDTVKPSAGRVLRYARVGAPSSVLKMEQEAVRTDADALGANEVRIRLLSSPVTHLDLQRVGGRLPGYSPASLPAVAGMEGAGIVEAVGSAVSSLKRNDLAMATNLELGTWREQAVVTEDDLVALPEGVTHEYASAMLLGPCVALRLLRDFVQLDEGDVLVHNAANGSIGQSVVQLAAAAGVHTVSVVRERPEPANRDTVERIKAYGGYVVVHDQYLPTPEGRRVLSDLPAPKLALDGVGGQSGADIARLLAPNGTLVSYGNASGRGIHLPSSLLTERNINVRGFSMPAWLENHDVATTKAMLQEMLGMVKSQDLRCWIETYRFTDFQEAIEHAAHVQRNRKVVMSMDF
jgi:mitochondrial enoyl-[acyl-carrier protein] reductase / trans-2-enoyl-CoA reductase